MELKPEELSEEQRQIAETIGMEAYLKLTRRYGGTLIYVAKVEENWQRRKRDEQIREEFDALDAIEAVLPAGTLSGAPKIRACQLIGELENNKRGIYGGAIGYIDFTGNMDTCIAIRIAYKKNGHVFVRSGAGIVADSDPPEGV